MPFTVQSVRRILLAHAHPLTTTPNGRNAHLALAKFVGQLVRNETNWRSANHELHYNILYSPPTWGVSSPPTIADIPHVCIERIRRYIP